MKGIIKYYNAVMKQSLFNVVLIYFYLFNNKGQKCGRPKQYWSDSNIYLTVKLSLVKLY